MRHSGLRVVGLALLCVLYARVVRADEVGSAVYIRADSDHTTVVAPRVRAQIDVGESTKATAVYAVDVWTSASIDIVSSASRVPVTEQRDEIDLSLDHELTDLTFTAAYRLSIEPDYVSNGVSGGASYDFADNNATVALGLSGSSDDVGRAGDPNFSRSSGTAGGRLSFTQVLSKGTLSQLMYEISRVSGFQASPYRFVSIGGGVCTEGSSGPSAGMQLIPVAPLCVPENSPGERLRHAIALELRQALGSAGSIAAGYRFYTDDWGLTSHTVRLEGSYLPDPETILSARYRFYVQGAAKHYRATYLVPQPYVTSDKELSPLTSHRLGLEADRVWSFSGGGTLTTTLSLAPIFYSYSDFVPLSSMTAFEVTAGVVYTP